jgi:hypothetical protein
MLARTDGILGARLEGGPVRSGTDQRLAIEGARRGVCAEVTRIMKARPDAFEELCALMPQGMGRGLDPGTLDEARWEHVLMRGFPPSPKRALEGPGASPYGIALALQRAATS